MTSMSYKQPEIFTMSFGVSYQNTLCVFLSSKTSDDCVSASVVSMCAFLLATLSLLELRSVCQHYWC